VTLRARHSGPAGSTLAVPRTRVLDASTLLSRDGSELHLVKPAGNALGRQSAAQGLRPVYKVQCRRHVLVVASRGAGNIEQVNLSIDRVAWRFSDDAKGAVVRPKASAAGEFEIHGDSCTGPLLARLPLAPVVRGEGQNELNARVFHVEAECCS